jgi:hypothetical protein
MRPVVLLLRRSEPLRLVPIRRDAWRGESLTRQNMEIGVTSA